MMRVFANFLRAFVESFAKRKVPVVDLTMMPPNEKKIYGPRDPELVNLVVVHVTAVKGGFGVTPLRVAAWRKAMDEGKLPPGSQGNLRAFLPETHASLLALWERYAALPYHWIASRVGGGHAVHNFLPSMKTIHAHAGNRGVGWAIDCDYDEPLTEALIEAGKESLRRCIQEVRAAHDGAVFVAPHRAFSDTRLNDPGPRVWADIVLPVVASIPYACVKYDHCEGTGRPVPNTWDAAAIFDSGGKLAK